MQLVVTGEAHTWLPALEKIVGPDLLRPVHARSEGELLDVVQAGRVDAALLDEEAEWNVNALQLLRMIRRLNKVLPVVVVTRRSDRRWLEDALRLTAFSVLSKPLELEPLLRQIHRIMTRLNQVLHEDRPAD